MDTIDASTESWSTKHLLMTDSGMERKGMAWTMVPNTKETENMTVYHTDGESEENFTCNDCGSHELGVERQSEEISEIIEILPCTCEDGENEFAVILQSFEKKVIRLMKIHKEKEFYETAVKELGLAAQTLKQTLVKIEKKETFKEKRTYRFANSRGRLPFPVEGKIVKGYRRPGTKRSRSQKGIFIEGSSDADVKAVFPGRVDYSGWLRGVRSHRS